jgi:hypothetical protein
MRTWQSSGLLQMVTEKVAILNDPYPTEIAIAREFGFEVVQPKDIPQAKVTQFWKSYSSAHARLPYFSIHLDGETERTNYRSSLLLRHETCN